MAERVSSPRFIGRSRELEAILAAVQAAGSGGPRLVLVDGEAGLGKSRLVAEATAQATDRGTTVACGSCLALGEEGVPYAPFTEVVRRLCATLPPAELRAFLDERGAPLARLLPELPAVPDPPGPAERGAADRAALFEAVVALVERIAGAAGGGSLVVAVEDLHWADRSSRELLGFMIHRARGPVVFLATCRTGDLESAHPLRAFLAEADRSGHLARVSLERFDRSQVFDQLSAILGVTPSAQLADDIWARSEGNPFLAEELLALDRSGHRSGFPGTLRDLLLARTASLDDATQKLLRIASVGGRRVDERLLVGVTGLTDDDVVDATRRATEAAVLHADPSDGRLAFRHALFQEAIYAELLPGERRRHHLAFGGALVDHPEWAGRRDDVPAELAHHFYAGGDLPRALEASLAAARSAEARTAFPEASRHYQRAIDVWDDVPGAETAAGVDRVGLLERAADVAVLAGALDRAVTLVRRSLDAIGAAGDPVRRALLHERLARILWLAGDANGSVVETEHAVRLLPSQPPSAERARVVAADGQSFLLAGRYSESRARAAEAVELARVVGSSAVEGHALNTLGLDLVYLGQGEAGLECLHRARQLAEELGRVEDLQRAYFNLATAAGVLGRLADAVAIAREGANAVGRLGFEEGRGYLSRKAAEYQLQLGRWDEAAALCRQVLELVRTPVTLIQTHTIAGTLELRRGRLDAARAHLELATVMSAEMAGGWFHGWLLCVRAELALAEGRSGDALAVVEEALAAMAGTDAEILLRRLVWVGLRAQAVRAAGATAHRAAERESARAGATNLADRVGPVIAGMRARGVGPYPEGDALEATVTAELAGMEETSPAREWSDAAEAWADLGQPFETAYARWRQGAASLAARSDRRETETALREARSIAAGLGAEPLRLEVEDLARRARLDVTGATGTATDGPSTTESPAEAAGLTKREAEVLGLVAAGRSNRQVAETLFMSEKTASVHVSRILTKLAVASRGEAAALAHRLGLVENADA